MTKTVCRDCIFAKYKDSEQTGCEFHNRLDVFKERNLATLIEWDVKKHYEINGICNACYKDKPGVTTLPEEARPVVDNRIYLDNTFVLPIQEENDAAIKHFVHSGRSQGGKKPKLLLVFGKDVSTPYANGIYRQYSGSISVNKILTDDKNIMDMCLKTPKTMFITLFEPGFKLPEDFNMRLNSLFNYDMMRFLAIKPLDGYHGLVVLSHLARHSDYEGVMKLNKNVLEWSEWKKESL